MSGGGSRTRDDIAYGFDINNLENGIRGIQNGLADGFYEVNDNMHLTTSTLQNGLYGINTGIMQGVNALQMGMNTGFNGITGQLTSMAADSAACCCETQSESTIHIYIYPLFFGFLFHLGHPQSTE